MQMSFQKHKFCCMNKYEHAFKFKVKKTTLNYQCELKNDEISVKNRLYLLLSILIKNKIVTSAVNDGNRSKVLFITSLNQPLSLSSKCFAFLHHFIHLLRYLKVIYKLNYNLYSSNQNVI